MSTQAWLAWVVMTMAIALTTTNPFYLAIVLLAVVLVAVLAPKTASAVAGFRTVAVFGLILFGISMGIAVINGNAGSHILLTVPGPDVPGWLGGLRLGGPVTGEGLVAATVRGLAILCVMLAFAAFNGAVSPQRVLRLAPAALFHAGLVVTVGLTLLPASIDDVRRIREMRALRGAGTGPRQLPALVVPAVIGGLERSMKLAEAMEARGYASSPPLAGQWRVVGALSVPLLLAAAWGWSYYDWAKPYAAAAALLGLAALAAWGVAGARARRVTRLNTERAPTADRFAVVCSLLSAAAVVLASGSGWDALKYNPFGNLPWPEFALPWAWIPLACAWPVVFLFYRPAPAVETTESHPAREAIPT